MITILEKFKTFLPSLNEFSFKAFEADILKNGCLDDLIVWNKDNEDILVT